ncbi:MAG: hypothetical protein JWR75_454 [Devosia sp.]|nr:hypothetical protein [Devosia sp.]
MNMMVTAPTQYSREVPLPERVRAVAFFMECLAGERTERRLGGERRQSVVPLVFANSDLRSGRDRRRAV